MMHQSLGAILSDKFWWGAKSALMCMYSYIGIDFGKGTVHKSGLGDRFWQLSLWLRETG